MDYCTGSVNPSEYLRFILKDCVTNTENNRKAEIDDLPLEKKNFCIGTSSTIHKGVNDFSDWKWVRRNLKFNVNDW